MKKITILKLIAILVSLTLTNVANTAPTIQKKTSFLGKYNQTYTQLVSVTSSGATEICVAAFTYPNTCEPVVLAITLVDGQVTADGVEVALSPYVIVLEAALVVKLKQAQVASATITKVINGVESALSKTYQPIADEMNTGINNRLPNAITISSEDTNANTFTGSFDFLTSESQIVSGSISQAGFYSTLAPIVTNGSIVGTKGGGFSNYELNYPTKDWTVNTNVISIRLVANMTASYTLLKQ